MITETELDKYIADVETAIARIKSYGWWARDSEIAFQLEDLEILLVILAYIKGTTDSRPYRKMMEYIMSRPMPVDTKTE